MNRDTDYTKLITVIVTVILSAFGSGEVIDFRAAKRSEEISQQNHDILEIVARNQKIYIDRYNEMVDQIEKTCPNLGITLERYSNPEAIPLQRKVE